jgi:hypothetical protein
VPQTLYKPIEQQAVLLKDIPVKKSNRNIGREFMSFIKNDESLRVIFESGYDLP